MSGAYTSDGKRRSAMTHSTRSHRCSLCQYEVFGNGGEAAHGRRHVRRGEAVELLKEFATYPPMRSRLFLAPGNPDIERLLSEGFSVVRS